MTEDRRTRGLQNSLRALGLLLSLAGFLSMTSPALAGPGRGVFVLGVGLWLAHAVWRGGKPRAAAVVAAAGLLIGGWLAVQGALRESGRISTPARRG